MGVSVTGTSEYRLLFIQPDPDLAERVCIGVLFEARDVKPRVLYDAKLSKLRCVAPSLDLSLVRYFLDSLEEALADADEVNSTLRTYAPQLSVSPPRQVRSPLSESDKLYLLHRFALANPPALSSPVTLADTKQAARVVENEIQLFVERFSAPLRLHITPKLRAHHLFGHGVPNVEPVAVGIRNGSDVVLIDGVDLRSSTPNKSIEQANRVVHTFWQWGRLRTKDLLSDDITLKRVGVVLNGIVPKGKKNVKKFLDAHDYALDQLGKESELTIDSSSDRDAKRFRDILLGGQLDNL
jgi:hypothetical protein